MCGPKLSSISPFLLSSYAKFTIVTAIAGSSFFNTSGSLYYPPQSKIFTVGNSTHNVNFPQTSEMAADIIDGKRGFMRFKYSNASHFVLIDRIDSNEYDL